MGFVEVFLLPVVKCTYCLNRFMLQAIPAIKWTDDKIPLLLQMVDNMNEILRKSLSHTEQLVSSFYHILVQFSRT